MEKTIETGQSYPDGNISESRKTISLYIAFFGSVFLGMYPSPYAAILSLIFLILTLLALYRARRHAEEDSPSYSHAHFLIRTFWNGNIILLLSLIVSVLYFLMFVRLGTLNPCVNALLSSWEYLITSANSMNLPAFIMPCEKPFIATNKTTLHITAFIAFCPLLLYLLIRFIRGWPRAIKNRCV